MKRSIGFVALGAFVASVVIANWLTTRYGFVPVGFGQAATAGTFAAGAALALRDGVQDTLGKRAVLAAIVVAAGLSWLVADPHIAAASAAAFAVSELLDMAVYTPLRGRAEFGGRRWSLAVLASSAAGAVADTAVFIGIAFGTAAISGAMAGQLIGKAWAALLFVAIGVTVRAVLRQPVYAERA